MFCATLTNVLVTLLLPVRDPPNLALRDISNHAVHTDRLRLYRIRVCIPPHRFPRIPRLIPPFLLHSIEIVFHSILACRLMIGIREASQSSGETFELSEVHRYGTIEFARRSSGEIT